MFGRGWGHHYYDGPQQEGQGFPWQQGGPQGGPWGGPRGPRGPWGGPRGPWRGGFGGWQGQGFSPEFQALRSTAGEVARLFMIAGRSAWGNPERQARLRDFLERSRKELLEIIGEAESKGESQAKEEQV
jgi:hypothetical protein